MAASEAGAPDSDHHHHHHQKKKKKIELVSIPPFFRCPISLDLMRDPVSLCNGVTYDRPSIEAWFDRGNKTCPATMDLLPNQALTPNHTLRRLIQEWCVANRSLGIERIPTPKAPADPSQVRRLLHHLITDPSTRVQPALKELRSLAKDSLGNAICVVQNGAPTVLAFFLASNCVGVAASDDVGMKKTAYVEEALHILSLLPLDEQAIEVLTRQDHVAPLAILLNQGSMEARADVATLVERLAVDERRQAVMGAVEGITPGLVALLRDTSFFMFPAPRLLSVEKVCLKALYALNLCRRNAAQTVDSGAVEMLIERLADADVDKDTTEASLALLELLCRSAEGRGAMVAHTLGVPMIVKKLLSASDLATEHALGALLSICSHSYVSSHHQAKQADHSSPIRDAASSGACAKLCLLLQVQCTPKARTRASKLLSLLHSSINCPCSHDSSF